jgi:spore germination protein GerM
MKPIASIAALSALTILFAACASSGSAGTVPPLEPTPAPSVAQGSPDLTPAPSESTPASTEPSGSPQVTPVPTVEDTTIVRAYFYLSEGTDAGLVPVLREVPATKAVATAAMAALLEGPTETESGAMSSAVPAGTRLLGLTVANGVATVDLSSEFESGGGNRSVITRLGQVVFTLTQFPTVKSVVFQIEGRTVTVFGSEGIVLDGPVARDNYLDLLPAIFVDRPAYGAALGNPGRVTGSAQGVFEATFRITLLDAGGKTIADQQAMAACMCESGAFDVTVRYDVSKAQWGTLRVWAASAKDGSPVAVREYPVWLTPAS